MGRPIKVGSTDQSTIIRILDSTTFLPEEAVEHDTSGIDLWYRREGGARVAITEASLASADAAHSDGGIEHIDDGYYRLDLPDAAVAAGAAGVAVGGTVTGMIVVGNYHTLTAYDPYDAVRIGMTALPNAAADAAGGLPISDAGGLDLDTKLANTNEVTSARMGTLTDWINGGRLDLLVDAIKAKTDSLTFTVAGDVDCNVQTWKGSAAENMTGDSYSIVTNNQYGNAKLVRSTTPDNTLTVDANNKVAVPDTQKVDLNTIKTLSISATPPEIIFGTYVGGTAACAIASEVTSARMGALTDWIDGGRLDLLLDSVISKVDVVDGIVDSILVDTGTTLDGKIDTIDGIVDSILVDTGTTLDGKIDTIDTVVDSILVDTALLEKVLKNKKVVSKSGSTWSLIVYDNDGTTPIITKALKDKNGDDISDLAAGALSQELANSV